ncbi:MAG TPA: hypothetical protein VHA14_04605 [Bryobacteraceae bacterium]|nr:hypothetical protein [Bryobacteraceae bacterium]
MRRGRLCQNKTLDAVFVPSTITVDGKAEDSWSRATPAPIAICMNAQKTAQLVSAAGHPG